MFVILAYDVRSGRLSKVRKIAEKYLQPAQKSVFDGYLTDRALTKLKNEMENAIDCDADSVIIYKQLFNGELIKCQLGRHRDISGFIL
jgi:CRISPR-associated protein Cas2